MSKRKIKRKQLRAAWLYVTVDDKREVRVLEWCDPVKGGWYVEMGTKRHYSIDRLKDSEVKNLVTKWVTR